MLQEMIADIQLMLREHEPSFNLNPVVADINRHRGLGSGNQCYQVMYRVARFLGVKKILEIGTHRGASSIVFCQAILDSGLTPEVHTVDNWSQASLKDLAASNISRSGFMRYVTMHDGDSLVKVPEVLAKIGMVDLAFIDGNHAIDYVIKDYINCRGHSNRILFHDTGDGDRSYLKMAESDRYIVHNFQTRYIEGDGHLIGIALAVKE